MYLTISLLYKTQNVEFFSLIAYISNISIGSYMVFFFFNVYWKDKWLYSYVVASSFLAKQEIEVSLC